MSKRCLLSLVGLLLLSSVCYSDYDGPDLPVGWHPISDEQLQALEQESILQAALVERLRVSLTEVEQRLRTAQKLSTSLTLQLAEVKASWTTLDAKVETLILQRNIAAVAGGILAIVAIVAFIL